MRQNKNLQERISSGEAVSELSLWYSLFYVARFSLTARLSATQICLLQDRDPAGYVG